MTKKIKKDSAYSLTGIGQSYKSLPIAAWTSNQITQYIRKLQKKHFFQYTKEDEEYYNEEYYDLGFGGQRRGVIWTKVKICLVNHFGEPEEVKEYIDWVFYHMGKKFTKPIPIGFILCKYWKDIYKKSKGKVIDKKGRYGE